MEDRNIYSYIHRSKAAFVCGDFHKAIKELDIGIKKVNSYDSVILISEKIKIIEGVKSNVVRELLDRNTFLALQYFRVMLDLNKYVEADSRYEKIILEAAEFITTYLMDDSTYSFTKEFIDLVKDNNEYFSGEKNLYINLSILINNYLVNYEKESKTLDESMEELQWAMEYLASIDIEINRIKIYGKFNKYFEMLDILNSNFKLLIGIDKGRAAIDLIGKSIKDSNNRELKLEYIKILDRYSIPKYFNERFFVRDFMEEKMVKEFKEALQYIDLNVCEEIYKCLNKYFSLEKIEECDLINFYKKTRKINEGINYFKDYLVVKGYQYSAILEYGEFLVAIYGLRQGLRELNTIIDDIPEELAIYCKLELASNAKSAVELYSLIEKEFEKIIRSVKGKKYLDKFNILLKDEINIYYKNKFINILKGNYIPELYIKDSFYENFSEDYLIKEFNRKVRIKSYNNAEEIFLCINKYFNIGNVDNGIVGNFLRNIDNVNLGIEYYNNKISLEKFPINEIINKCNFIKFKSGSEDALLSFGKELGKLSKDCDLLYLCKAIEAYEEYCVFNLCEIEFTTYLTDIKFSKYVLYFVYPLYKEIGVVALSDLINKLKNNINEYFDEEIINLLDMLSYYYTFEESDWIDFVEYCYNLKKYKLSLALLENIQMLTGDKVIYLKMKIYRRNFLFEEVKNSGEELLDVDNKGIDSKVINYYFNSMFNLRGFAELIENGEKLLKSCKNKIKEEDLNVIYSYMFKAAVNDGKPIKSLKLAYKIILNNLKNRKSKFNLIVFSIIIGILCLLLFNIKATDNNESEISKPVGNEKFIVEDAIKEEKKVEEEISEFIIKESNSKYIKEEELKEFNLEELALARNEIYARNGQKYTREPYKSYFGNKEWYNGDKVNVEFNSMNKYEQANILLIKEVERKKGKIN